MKTADMTRLDGFRMDNETETFSLDTTVGEPSSRYRYTGQILCFDQTLKQTGWVSLLCENGQVQAIEGGDYKRETGDPGFAGNFHNVDLLAADVYKLISSKNYDIEHIVYEMPAVKGYRTDSSLMAATVVSTVATILGIPHFMINKRHVAKVLTGNVKATKAQIKKVVLEEVPNMKDMRPINMNVTDAAAVGLVWLMEHG